MANIVSRTEYNGYTYTQYDNGTVKAEGDLIHQSEPRSQSAQSHAGGESRLATDHGGHLIGAANGGMKNGCNISAQDGGLNTGAYRSMERDSTAAYDKGFSVHTERTSYCGSDANRPDAYMVNDHVTAPDGHSYDVHHSYTNTDMSQYEHSYEGLQDAPDSYTAPGGAAKYGMSDAEFSDIMNSADEMSFNDYDGEWNGYSCDASEGESAAQSASEDEGLSL